jgi:hypothetical protein
MLRTALAMFLVGGIAASAQAQNGATGGADKVDRASAYYYYALAHMYAEMATTSAGRNREYEDKSIENYKAAVKADPQAPALLQGIRPFFPLWIPAAHPTRILPKAEPSK